MRLPGLTHAASAHYMIHSFIKYWNGATINWTLTNGNTMFSAKCTEMAITSYYASGNTPTTYLIICPYEGKYGSGDKITA